MDYGKYKYEQEQKAKQARKHQSQIQVKEIKLRPKIGIHDYNTKKGHVALVQESLDVALLGVVVVNADLRPELDLLHLDLALVLAGLLRLLLLLVPVLAVVHDL